MNKNKIINTHSHINMLKERTTEEALKNCDDENVTIIVPSYDDKSIFEVNKLIKKYPQTYGYVGIFPEEAKCFNDNTLSDMEQIIKNNDRIIGIGEIGLDYYWDRSFVGLQKEVFIKQIEFANQMNLPINIHCRDAYFDTLNILREHNKGSKVIMHCFSGSLEFAKECIKEGFYISIGGVVTFKNAVKVKEVAQNIPIEYLLLETDDPYLTPVPFRGKENQPAYIKYVANEIASLRGISFEQVANATTKNAKDIFQKIN